MGPVFSFGRALPDILTAMLTVSGCGNKLQITEREVNGIFNATLTAD